MIWAARFLHFELELEFAYTKIHAPIDGRVTKTDITELSAVIIDKQVYINFSISDHQLLKLRRARIQLPLRAVFDNPNGKLLPGLFLRIRMPVSDPQDTILIPVRAIVRDRDTSFVMVVGENNLVQRRDVQLGEQTGGWAMIAATLFALLFVPTSFVLFCSFAKRPVTNDSAKQ